MNIKAPLRRKYEALLLIRAGADELYCGVCDKGVISGQKWKVNNLQSLEELKDVVKIAKGYGVPVSLTLNNQLYNDYDAVLRIAEKAACCGVSSFIICNNALIQMLTEMDLDVELHLSCMASCFNAKSIEFYKHAGITRVTLPRQLTTSEIEHISKKAKGIDLEVMIYNGRCKNDNGLCRFNHPPPLKRMAKLREDDCVQGTVTYQKKIEAYMSMINFLKHGIKNKACNMIDFDIGCLGDATQKEPDFSALHDYFNKDILIACGLCSIYPFNKAGIKSVKLVGREYPVVKKIFDIMLIKKSVDMLKKDTTKKQFEENAQLLQQGITKRLVCDGKSCYYH